MKSMPTTPEVASKLAESLQRCTLFMGMDQKLLAELHFQPIRVLKFDVEWSVVFSCLAAASSCCSSDCAKGEPTTHRSELSGSLNAAVASGRLRLAF
jgi:hypothetical protein